MNDLDYYLLQQEEERQQRGESAMTDEQLMAAAYSQEVSPQVVDRETMEINRPSAASYPQGRDDWTGDVDFIYGINNGVDLVRPLNGRPLPYIGSGNSSDDAGITGRSSVYTGRAEQYIPRQRTDRETMGIGRPQPAPQPQQSGYNPWPQRIAENRAASAEAWGNFFKTLGPSNRRQPIDYSAPERARSMVRNQYLAENANRRQNALANLQMQKMRQELQPKPVDEIKRATDFYNMLKAKGEVAKGEREAVKADQESANKQALVEMINSSGKVGENAASMAFSLRTLEQMGKDIGLSELDLKKAKASGGIRESVYSSSKSPEVSQALRGQIKTDLGKFMSPSENQAMDTVMDSGLPAKTKNEYIEKFEERAMDNEKRARDTAESTMQTIYDKDRNTIEIYTKLNMLQRYIDSHPKMEGYTRLTSTGRQLPFGTAAIKAITNDEEVIKLFTLIDGVEQAFARAKSGSAINAGEWVKFKDELGSGALSDAKQLSIGVKTMREGIKNTIKNEWQRVPGSVRYEDQYLERLKIFSIKKPPDMNELANKYRVE